MAGDTGVVLQNRGSFFSLDPGHVNALAPGKRTMHTLIPSMYLEGGRPRFVYGTMGGEGQPQTQAAILTRRLFRRLGPQAAIEAPRWLYGRTWGTRVTGAQPRGTLLAASSRRDLAGRGHEVAIGGEWDDLFGHAHVHLGRAGGRRPGRRVGPAGRRRRAGVLGVAAGEGLVELDAHLREIGAGLDGQPRIGPGAEPALQDLARP